MEAPTTAQIRTWSRVDFANLEYAEPAGEAEDGLDVLVARAKDYVLNVTGRTLDSVPDDLVTTAQEAIQRRTEQLAFQEQDDHVETASDELIESFGAGSYNEKKRGAGDLSPKETKLVNPWPLLSDLLWRLMTEEKREEWEEWMGGGRRPNFAVTEVDWSAGDILDNARDPYLYGA